MIILASTSPRRIELLGKLTKDFKTISPLFDEKTISKSIKNYPLEMSKNKANSVKNLAEPQDFLISCDTIVKYKDQILGKPKDLEEAKKFLRMLSGKCHKVITGTTILYKDKTYYKTTTSYVFFEKLSEKDIEEYIKKVNVLDKAGGYAAQNNEEAHVVKKIMGDYYNVIGFPLGYIEKMLKKFKLI